MRRDRFYRVSPRGAGLDDLSHEAESPSSSITPDRVEKIVRDVAGHLVPASARIDVDRFSSPDITSIWLMPIRKTAATLTLGVDDSGFRVYLLLGRAIRLEIDRKGSTITKAPADDEIRMVCRAIVKGQFKEQLWLRNSEIRRALGILTLDNGSEIKLGYGNAAALLLPFGERTTVEYVYTPYDAP